MATTFESRTGTFPEEGIKSPCKVAATANVTLSGEQTISAVAVTAGDRVLTTAQTDATENGIWVAAVGAWTRATDWNAGNDVGPGMLVGEYTTKIVYVSVFTGDFVAGTTEVTFSRWPTADSITGEQLNPDIAGDGLSQDGSGNLQINVDDLTIEIAADTLRVKDDGITKDKINANVAGTGLTQNLDGSLEVDISTALGDDSVPASAINPDVAGDGIGQDGTGALKINVDGVTLEISADTLRVKDDGISAAKLNADVAGNGLSQTGAGILQVNVDNSSLQISADTLQIKASGVGTSEIANLAVTEAKLATAVQDKLNGGNGQNIYIGNVVASASPTWYANPTNPGWSLSSSGTGFVTVTHNLGHLNYSVVASAVDVAAAPRIINITDKSANSFDVGTWTTGASSSFGDFYFILIEQ